MWHSPKNFLENGIFSYLLLGEEGALNFKYAWVEHGLGWEIVLWLHFIFISYFSCQYLSYLQLSSFLWEFQFWLQKQHYMHIPCQILDRGLGMSYSGVIRLFYVPKSYPSVSGEQHVHLVGAGEGGQHLHIMERRFFEKKKFLRIACVENWPCMPLDPTWPWSTRLGLTKKVYSISFFLRCSPAQQNSKLFLKFTLQKKQSCSFTGHEEFSQKWSIQ